MPSAFDFSDFDLPAVAEADVPTTFVDAPAAAPSPFSFDTPSTNDLPAAAPAPAPATVGAPSLDKTPATAPNVFDFDQQTRCRRQRQPLNSAQRRIQSR
jgi:hypothetical protein